MAKAKVAAQEESILVDVGKANYEEALAEAQKQFDFVSQTGDRALILKAAQKVADIKQQELDRLEGLSK